MRRPAKNSLMAAGSLAIQKIWRRLARIVRMRSMMSGSTLRKPLASDTVMGKNVPSTTSSTFGMRP